MEKKVIGYKLIKPEMYKTASYMLYGNTMGSAQLSDYLPTDVMSRLIERLKDAGVLDLWFEPVYEEVTKFKIGDWIYIISTGSSISGELNDTQEVHYGASKGSVVQIKGITFKGGNASKKDPRYYGDNFNLREEGFRKATPEEIAKAQVPDITIKGYKAEFTKDSVKFGCQTYSKEFVVTLAKCLVDNGFDMDIKGEIIEIAEYFNSL